VPATIRTSSRKMPNSPLLFFTTVKMGLFYSFETQACFFFFRNTFFLLFFRFLSFDLFHVVLTIFHVFFLSLFPSDIHTFFDPETSFVPYQLSAMLQSVVYTITFVCTVSMLSCNIAIMMVSPPPSSAWMLRQGRGQRLVSI
jgi:hypothetical protein